MFFRKLTPYLAAQGRHQVPAGFFEVNGAVLYVTRGLGAGVPVRFRAPMEVACLTLRSSAPRTLVRECRAVAPEAGAR